MLALRARMSARRAVFEPSAASAGCDASPAALPTMVAMPLVPGTTAPTTGAAARTRLVAPSTP